MKKLVSKIVLLSAIISVVSLGSCTKDKTKTLDLEVKYKVDNESFAYDQVYTINNTAIKFSLVQFYLSGLYYMDMESNMYKFENKYFLVKPTQSRYSFGELPENYAPHMHMFGFNVGIDSATNAQTETTFMNRAEDDPLAAQNPAMHWSWNSGYIFLKIDAMVDTSGDGTVDVPAEYHIGMNQFLRNGSVMFHQDLENGENVASINFNVAALFDGIDPKTEYSTHTMDNMPLANKMAANISAAFTKAD